jgi:hypothetical protein
MGVLAKAKCWHDYSEQSLHEKHAAFQELQDIQLFQDVML